jgi:hypothetical protein
MRARAIIQPSCLAIRQAIRAKLYNKCLLFVFKKFLSPISSHNTCYLGPLIPMLPCPAWCLHESQALISLLLSLLHISISLAINPLLYMLWEKKWEQVKWPGKQGFPRHERKASTSRLQSLCALLFFSTASLGCSGLAERRSEESAAGSGGRACTASRSLHSGACPRLCLGCCLVSFAPAGVRSPTKLWLDFDLVYQVLHEMFDRLLISFGSLERWIQILI